MEADISRIALLPLARDSILLPGCTLRIPLSNRPDVPVLLASLFSKSSQQKTSSSTIIGCIPLKSPLLSVDGKQLLDSKAGESGRGKEADHISPAKATANDLFKYGTVAKIIGVQGRPASEPYLLVEGVKRFTVATIIQETPYMEADIRTCDDEGVYIWGLAHTGRC